MDAGGWNLIYNWLKDAVETDNIVLIQDLLTIFHIVPVTMERLKANGGPKLVKKLSKTHIDQGNYNMEPFYIFRIKLRYIFSNYQYENIQLIIKNMKSNLK